MKQPKRKRSRQKCEMCKRQLWMLPDEKGKFETVSVFSTHTGNRYCMPGEGCFK